MANSRVNQRPWAEVTDEKYRRYVCTRQPYSCHGLWFSVFWNTSDQSISRTLCWRAVERCCVKGLACGGHASWPARGIFPAEIVTIILEGSDVLARFLPAKKVAHR